MESMNQIQSFADTYERIRAAIAREMIGQEQVVQELLLCLVAGGNVLLEGVPGLGKTHLVRTLSHVLDLPFSRIQFTPDLMPADITGTQIMNRDHGFVFQKGPVFASIVLADEINRATPKTQSALLEVMQEHAVTVGGTTYPLPEPYFVMATQNPLEQEGTYPLPEAQLDRFLMKILVPFPSLEELKGIVHLKTSESVPAVAGAGDLMQLRRTAREVPISASVEEFALQLVMNTHPELPDAPEAARASLRFGASPRAAQAILATARVRALREGRFNVSFEDIRSVAPSCLRHRLALTFEAISGHMSVDDVIQELLAKTGGREHAQ